MSAESIAEPLSTNTASYTSKLDASSVDSSVDPKNLSSFISDLIDDYQQCIRVILTMFPIILWCYYVNATITKYSTKKKLSLYKIFIIEYTTIIIVIIINTTVLNNHIYEINIVYLLIFIGNILMKKSKIKNKTINEEENTKSSLSSPFRILFNRHLACITLSRSSINIFTSACILAVDFKIFPMNFGKTRTFGISLMDTGIGLFIFSAGIAWKDNLQSSPNNFETKKLMVLVKNIIELSKESSILFLLGIIRIMALKMVNYHQDITEYGRHWNAFMTIAVTKFFGNYLVHEIFAMKLTHSHRSQNHNMWQLIYIAFGILCSYELILKIGLYDFIFDPDTGRVDFFRANREGIFSTIGHVSLYLMAIFIGLQVKTNNAVCKTSSGKLQLNCQQFNANCMRLIRYSSILWIIVAFLIPLTGISRRTANAGYVLWILAVGTSMLALYMLYEKTIIERSKSISNQQYLVPFIMDAVNYNGLITFLLSNLLTGLINKIIKVEDCGIFQSLFILCTYISVTYIIVGFLYAKRIRIA